MDGVDEVEASIEHVFETEDVDTRGFGAIEVRDGATERGDGATEVWDGATETGMDGTEIWTASRWPIMPKNCMSSGPICDAIEASSLMRSLKVLRIAVG